MKRRKTVLLCAAMLTILCISCGRDGNADDTITRETDFADIITVTGDIPETEEPLSAASTEESYTFEMETAETETQPLEPETGETQTSVIEVPVSQLTEGEKAARREQQKNFEEARQTLYLMENSMDKTTRINQMDRQILENNSYNFSSKNVVFIGDSITEGITSAVDQNGNFVSYVTYVNSYLHFAQVLNHGVGGRMFADYGGDELSITSNFGNVTNTSADIIVVFAGVNDYLSVVENKRFGNVDDKLSTAGYCGAVRSFMDQLQRYYGDKEIFFVTMYNVSKTAECTYSDYNGQPTLGDYMEAERQLAREYGFHVIELYDIGFMDCSTKEASDYYLRDGLHPKDNGNIVLGEHIAAELSLYFSQKAE